MTTFAAKSRQSVDIIIAAKNEAAYIGMCIDSLLTQVSERFELVLNIIVIDNGSVDDTVEIAEAQSVSVYRVPTLTLAEVRNFGVAKGSGKYIAFLDADCTAEPNWLEVAISLLQNSNVGAVGGPYDVPENANVIERSWNIRSSATLHVEVEELATSSFVTKRATFEAVGGFDPKLGAGEDTEICLKIREHVGKLLLVGKCKVIHYGYPKTLTQFIKREYWHGLWDARRTRGWSKILILAYLFALSLPIALIALYFSFSIALLVFSSTMGLPTLLTFKKLRKGRFRLTFGESALLFVLQSLYLFTRAIAGICSIYTNLCCLKKGDQLRRN